MTRTLGWIAIVWALLGLALIPASSWAIRQQSTYKFRYILNPEEIQELAAARIDATRPTLIISAIHQIACLITGVGLLKRKSWARPAWLTLCWLGLGFVIVAAIWHRRLDVGGFTSVLLRAALLVWSIRVLGSRRARHEFASSKSR
jgi:hypothetical protein